MKQPSKCWKNPLSPRNETVSAFQHFRFQLFMNDLAQKTHDSKRSQLSTLDLLSPLPAPCSML
jgi:hypothetical protein